MEETEVISKAKSSFMFVMLAQVLVLMLGVFKSLILPKVLSVEGFGYWQVYLLYSSYVGVAALGFNDGIYLIYAKYQYNELPFEKLRSASRIYVIMLFALSLIICSGGFLITDVNRQFAVVCTGVDILFVCIWTFLIYVLQVTNQMKAYSFYSIFGKVLFLITVLFMLVVPFFATFRYVIAADVVSNIIVTIMLVCKCKDIFVGKYEPVTVGWVEFSTNIKVGINLMIANLMGMFVTGISRFVVDAMKNIKDYAYYAFGTSITSLVLIAISAISLVLYPTLKRLPEKNYGYYFEKITVNLSLFNFFALFAYFPAVIFVKYFLPKYTPMLLYLPYLFGVVALQAKMQLINNTYYNVLRKEKALMKANMSCVVLFVIIAPLLYYITHDISSVALSTFIVMLYRCYASEVYLRGLLGLKLHIGMWLEIAYIICWSIVLMCVNYVTALVVCILLFILYFIFILRNAQKLGVTLLAIRR